MASLRSGTATSWGARLTTGRIRKFNYQDAQLTQSGAGAGDPLRRVQLGGRLDWTVSPKTQVAIIGDGNVGSMGRVDRPATDVHDGNILARLRHQTARGADLQVQAYYDRTFRSTPGSFEEDRGTWDLDVQYRTKLSERHMLLAGGGYRLSRDRTSVPPRPGGARGAAVVFVPASRQSPLLAAFAQDEIVLVPRKVTLTVGVRGEHNEFSGFEFQPTVRARWIPRTRHVVWGALSRAVRTPTRLDVDVRSVLPDGQVVLVGGGDQFTAESVVAYEAGYRVQPHPLISIDIAAYHNEYNRLRSQEPGSPIVLANGLRGRTNGLETEVTVRPTGWMRWQGSWTLFDKRLELRPGSADPTGGVAEGNDPRTSWAFARPSTCRIGPSSKAFFAGSGPFQRPWCPPTPSWISGRRGPSATISSWRWSAGTCCTPVTPSSAPRSPACGNRAQPLRAGARGLLMSGAGRTARLLLTASLVWRDARRRRRTVLRRVRRQGGVLYNFAKFVEWPAESFPSPDAPFAICVLGQDPFGRALDDIVEGERIQGRPLVVRRLKGWDGAELCHILFVSASAQEDFEQLLGGHTVPAHAHGWRCAAVPRGRRAHQLLSRRQQRPLHHPPIERRPHGAADQLAS